MNMLMANFHELEVHPACLILPEMDADDYEKLKEDISGFGLRHPIILYQGKILDGRHRYRACLELGIEPWFEDWQGGSSVVEFVLGENLYRRHLSQSQKAMVGANAIDYHRAEAKKRQLESAAIGGSVTINQRLTEATKSETNNKDSVPGTLSNDRKVIEFPINNGKSSEKLAEQIGVSSKLVEQAVRIKEQGTPQDVQEVISGKVSVKAKEAEIKERIKPKPIVSAYITPAQWADLSDLDRQAALTVKTDKKFNLQDNDSIDWAAYSWNPITGCQHDCQYCYARDIANRFYGELGFKPAFHPDRLLIPYNQKPGNRNNRVFTCSMADLFGEWVPYEWIEAVLAVCDESPAFDFLLLTKNPQRLREFRFPKNCWVGTTTDSQRRMDVAEKIFADVDAAVKWVSVEPMLEPIMPSNPKAFSWYVIGGASPSSGQPGFVPPFSWVARLALAAMDAGSQVFIKTNFWQAGRPQGFPYA